MKNYGYMNAYIAQKTNTCLYLDEDIFLVVEGPTDERFINRLDIKDLKCSSVFRAKKGGDAIYEALKNFIDNYQNDVKSNKVIVKNIVEKFSKEKNYPFDRIKLYGLIDKDFDALVTGKYILVTPTHDLETLLLKTDKTIFEKPEDITESLKDALYLAYLIGKVEYLIQENGYRYKKMENDDDYRAIIENRRIKIRLADIIIEKLMERDELWLKQIIKKEILKIDISETPEDLYEIANGHDILKIMRLLCESEINQFIKDQYAQKHKNNPVEFAVISKYNLKEFKDCPLYQDMLAKGFVPTAKEMC